eukprot:CAMPEP_0205812214 /NCGR_PEP_ID=MMETSP0205-20121125/16599_1 /ASSEMBLY_ACC=CAM_ASM_000278 /TAXON_ID=36767 /ORGANISM="Euplotes focardii, Strain TN1" /LENGTH=66 /DNA_ID=CAMNT_0053092531 /DNA_START=128 /DNA_END=324 /DNA_ORIENTATION=-
MKTVREEKEVNEVADLIDKIKVYVSEMENKKYTDIITLRQEFTKLKSSIEDLSELLEEIEDINYEV